jgi:hypothetical protein
MLTANDSKRYVAVHDDVIISVPDAARIQLVDFLRTQIMQRKLSEQSAAKRIGIALVKKVRSKIG